MSEARSQILAGIRRALRRGPPDAAARGAAEARLADHPRNLVPARGSRPHDEQVALFIQMAGEVAATVERVPALDRVPEAVAGFLARHNLPAEIRLAPDPQLDAVPWAARPTLAVGRGRAEDRDLTSVTAAVAGIAETGTILMVSGPEHPTTLNFLPDNHVVVLRADQIVGSYEDGWDILRARFPGVLPRTVNLVTGPSRTGDIEQQIQLGAHGPRRVHVILVDGTETAGP